MSRVTIEMVLKGFCPTCGVKLSKKELLSGAECCLCQAERELGNFRSLAFPDAEILSSQILTGKFCCK